MTSQTERDEKSKRAGQVRCPNCFARFRPPPGADRASCPACGREWYISWAGKLAKIRKPVWETWDQHFTETQQQE